MAKYEGYYWVSDETNPRILKEDSLFSFPSVYDSIMANPFVIEAMLYDKEQEVSVMVRHTGRYHIQLFDLKKMPVGSEFVEKKYLPHRLDGIEKVCFKQWWLPETKNGEFPVLTMQALIFTGFLY